MANNLVTRIIAALVLAPLALAAAWYGGILWALLAFVVGVGLYAEWLHIVGAWRWSVVASGTLTLAASLLTLWYDRLDVTALVILVGICALIGLLKMPLRWWSAAGLCYAASAMIASAVLRDGPSQGFIAIVFVFAIVWATDILGYVVGRSVGGPKLAPRISPNKTWAGLLGGVAAGMVVGLVGALWLGAPSVWPLLLASALLGIVEQAGDLMESGFKRYFGVKDSGRLIPGHGGFLDRVDGLLAVALAVALAQSLGGGILAWTR